MNKFLKLMLVALVAAASSGIEVSGQSMALQNMARGIRPANPGVSVPLSGGLPPVITNNSPLHPNFQQQQTYIAPQPTPTVVVTSVTHKRRCRFFCIFSSLDADGADADADVDGADADSADADVDSADAPKTTLIVPGSSEADEIKSALTNDVQAAQSKLAVEGDATRAAALLKEVEASQKLISDLDSGKPIKQSAPATEDVEAVQQQKNEKIEQLNTELESSASSKEEKQAIIQQIHNINHEKEVLQNHQSLVEGKEIEAVKTPVVTAEPTAPVNAEELPIAVITPPTTPAQAQNEQTVDPAKVIEIQDTPSKPASNTNRRPNRRHFNKHQKTNDDVDVNVTVNVNVGAPRRHRRSRRNIRQLQKRIQQN